MMNLNHILAICSSVYTLNTFPLHSLLQKADLPDSPNKVLTHMDSLWMDQWGYCEKTGEKKESEFMTFIDLCPSLNPLGSIRLPQDGYVPQGNLPCITLSPSLLQFNIHFSLLWDRVRGHTYCC